MLLLNIFEYAIYRKNPMNFSEKKTYYNSLLNTHVQKFKTDSKKIAFKVSSTNVTNKNNTPSICDACSTQLVNNFGTLKSLS